MGTILAKEIIADASTVLQDEGNVRWTMTEMLRWLNSGQKEAVIADPDINVKSQPIQLVAGTKQTLPAGGLLLLEVSRNMGANGTTPGKVPRYIEKALMDQQNPNWHADASSATVMHYAYDVRAKSTYWVYPPQPATGRGYVEILFSAAPTAVATGDDPITIDDMYSTALMNYILYMAFSKDPATMPKSDDRYKTFLALVIGKQGPEEQKKAPAKKEA